MSLLCFHFPGGGWRISLYDIMIIDGIMFVRGWEAAADDRSSSCDHGEKD